MRRSSSGALRLALGLTVVVSGLSLPAATGSALPGQLRGRQATSSARAADVVSHAAAPAPIRPGQHVHLQGTRIYCGVSTRSSGTLVTCLIVKKGTRTPEGYAVGISSGLAGVTHFVGNTAPTVFVRRQPALRRAPVPAGSGSGTVTLHVGQLAPVGGSDVVVAAGRNSREDPSIAAGIFDAAGGPADGSYTIGISEHEAVVLQWRHGKSTVVFRRAEPSS